MVARKSNFVIICVLIIIVVAFLIVYHFIGNEPVKPTIEIEQGVIQGDIWESRSTLTFAAYLGIPYAEPPIDDLRLMRPVKAGNWSGIRDSTYNSPSCMQLGRNSKNETIVIGQEDCLYINVYTPDGARSINTVYPVMVYIHGGGMVVGSGNSQDIGPQYLLDKDVVLVTFNYRLGLLAMLSFEEKDLPGNLGLKDQVMALKWVRNNIDKFGGDANRVTIFGESTGAVSVSLHLISPLSKGLFQQALSESGTALRSVLPKGYQRSKTQLFAERVNCTRPSTVGMVKCFQELKADLFNINDDIRDKIKRNEPYDIGIVQEPEDVNDPFITKNVWDELRKPSNVTWVVGVNSGESGPLATIIYEDDSLLDSIASDIYGKFPPLLGYFYNTTSQADRDHVTSEINKFYFNGKPIKNSFLEFIMLCSDRRIMLPSIKSALLYGGQTYFYYYAHVNEFRSRINDRELGINYGAAHGDEMYSLFYMEDKLREGLSGTDLTVSEQLIEYWTNFAIYGILSPTNSSLTKWNPLTKKNKDYLYINDGTLKMASHLREEAYNLWESFHVDHDS